MPISSFVGPDAKPALRVEWKDTAEYLSEKVEMPRGAIKTVVMFGRGDGNTLDASRVSLPAELYGEGGSDRLMGGPRYDVLDGGPGNDVLAGGGGGDTYRFVGGSLGSDAITEATGTDTDTLDFSRFSGAIALDLSSTLTQKVREAALSLRLSSSMGLENAIGSVFSDRIFGNSRNNFIKGGAGGDVINGRAGNDILWGEAGLDTLIGEAGDDRLVGGIDGLIDALFGGLGRDTFFGDLRERRDFTALDYFFQTPL